MQQGQTQRQIESHRDFKRRETARGRETKTY